VRNPAVAAPHRAVRALVLTGTAVTVGVAAHVAAGGAATVGGVAAAVPVLLALVWSLTDRERGWLPIAGACRRGETEEGEEEPQVEGEHADGVACRRPDPPLARAQPGRQQSGSDDVGVEDS